MDKLGVDNRADGGARWPTARDARPLHRRIADELRGQIAAGQLRPGDPLPSEHSLMRRYGVSRGTVRQARALLRADGTIGGSQGRALSVRGAPLTQPLGELVSFTTWTQSLGMKPGGCVVVFAPERADLEAAARLAIAPGAAVYRLMRLRLADGQPLMIERTIFPERIGALLRGVALDEVSVYAELASRGEIVASARHLIDAIAADAADARLLAVAAGTALLRVRRVAYSPAGEPVEWSDDRYLGDQVNFAIENSALAGGVVRLAESAVGSR